MPYLFSYTCKSVVACNTTTHSHHTYHYQLTLVMFCRHWITRCFLPSKLGACPSQTSRLSVCPLQTCRLGVCPLQTCRLGVCPPQTRRLGVCPLQTCRLGACPLQTCRLDAHPLQMSTLAVFSPQPWGSWSGSLLPPHRGEGPASPSQTLGKILLNGSSMI